MAYYAVSNSTTPAGNAQQSVTTSYKTLLAVAPSTNFQAAPVNVGLRRGKLYDILIGTNGTPADNFMEFDVARATVGTTVVWLGSISSVSSAYELDLADTGFRVLPTI